MDGVSFKIDGSAGSESRNKIMKKDELVSIYKRRTMNYELGLWKLFELVHVLQKPIILK